MIINSINLKAPYLTKKIEPTAFKTVLGSTYQTAYRLYLITNEIKELQYFIESKDQDYSISSYVKTIAAPAGDVKRQVWSIKHLSPLLQKKPKYELRCSVTCKKTNKEIYRCELTSINQTVIYKQIQDCISEIKQLLDEKNY